MKYRKVFPHFLLSRGNAARRIERSARLSGVFRAAARLALCAALTAAAAWAQPADEWIIETVAGGSFARDGGTAVRAWLRFPNGAAVDDAGNLYIADTGNHRIRKVDASGVISTVAGSGKWGGYGGDGGPALQARLFAPSGVAADGAGNLYIADSWNHRIRKVDAAGNISTVAGSGRDGYSGDGGPALRAQLAEPWDAAADGAGNLYIADTGNNRIRKVDAAGVISTVAGSGETGYSGDGGAAVRARLSHPGDVTVDRAGNIYIADSVNSSIRRLRRPGN